MLYKGHSTAAMGVYHRASLVVPDLVRKGAGGYSLLIELDACTMSQGSGIEKVCILVSTPNVRLQEIVIQSFKLRPKDE